MEIYILVLYSHYRSGVIHALTGGGGLITFTFRVRAWWLFSGSWQHLAGVQESLWVKQMLNLSHHRERLPVLRFLVFDLPKLSALTSGTGASSHPLIGFYPLEVVGLYFVYHRGCVVVKNCLDYTL